MNKSSVVIGELEFTNCSTNWKSNYSRNRKKEVVYSLPKMDFYLKYNSLKLRERDLLTHGISVPVEGKKPHSIQNVYVVATSADSYISKFKSQYKEFYKTPFIGDSAGHILIAAGNDIDTLIESYPLKEGYSVLPGKIYKNSDAELGTYFKLSLSDIEATVPSEYETSLDLANPKKNSATNSCKPEYTITVKWGSSGIPWIDDVGKIDG